VKNPLPNAPGWTFEIDQVATSIFKLVGTGPHGSRIGRLSRDYDDLVRFAGAAVMAATRSTVPFTPETQELADLPGWSFGINEVSANVWEVLGVGPNGASVRQVGTDENLALRNAIAKARRHR
jgi:hypothetical protein